MLFGTCSQAHAYDPSDYMRPGFTLNRKVYALICFEQFNFNSGISLRVKAMFTLYRIGFCSVSKVAPVQCEQEFMFCCGAEIAPKRSQCEQKPYPLCNLQGSLLI